MSKDDLTRLRHMLDAATEALSFAAGRSRQDLHKDRMLALSLVKDIEIIGEAAGKVSVETQGQHPEIPWSLIQSMRNRLIHAYFDVNLDVVWSTVQNDLPALVDTLERILASETGEA